MIQVVSGIPALVLAPMEGVTDAPMRALMSERGGFTYCVSEFLRISQEVPPPKTLVKHVPEFSTGCMTGSGLPVQVQFLGGDPEKLARAAVQAHQMGASAIDLNFGCPAPTVNRNDGGATLLKFPDRIKTIVSTVRAALPPSVPLSAKLRLGWDDPEAIHLNADMAAEGGASWITIHGRTRLQGYKPPAYWGPIGAVQKRIGIPVIANGDIWTLDDFKRCRDETRCEHFMLGRGALADPRLPLQIARELGTLNDGSTLDAEAILWHPLLSRFAELTGTFSDRPGYVPCRIKQWAKMVHLRFPISWYDTIKLLQSSDEMLKVLAVHDLQRKGAPALNSLYS